MEKFHAIIGYLQVGGDRHDFLNRNRDMVIESIRNQTGKSDYTVLFSFPENLPDKIMFKLVSPSVVQEFKNRYGDQYMDKLNEML